MTSCMTNRDGSLKPKEEVIEDISKIYDLLKEEESEYSISPPAGEEYYTMITKAENQIDTETIFETDEFLQRSIYINEEISDKVAQKVHHAIKFYNTIDIEIAKENRAPINIFINTDGGDLDAARSIMSSITVSTTPVYTWNIGKAYSAGFFILISGHKRFGFPQSSYLLHEGATGIYIDAHKFFQYSEHYKQVLEELRQFTLEHTKMSNTFFDSQKPNDVWFTAEKAIELGAIDSISEII